MRIIVKGDELFNAVAMVAHSVFAGTAAFYAMDDTNPWVVRWVCCVVSAILMVLAVGYMQRFEEE